MAGVTYRLKNGTYTDADVLALYMKYREEAAHGSFIREIGDFIAHRRRDRGATLEATVYQFSQLAFFQTYQGNNAVPLNPVGQCGWWLKSYFLGKVQDTPEKHIKKAIGLNRLQAMNEIKSWFDLKETYPTEIKCHNERAFHSLSHLFSRTIRGLNVFDIKKVKKELSIIFSREGIPSEEINNFIIATSIILLDKKCEILPGFNVSLYLSVGKTRAEDLGEITSPDGSKHRYCKLLPDGNLTIYANTNNNMNDGLINVAFSFLDTCIDTEFYFDRALIEVDEHGIPRLNFENKITFDRASNPMVRLIG